MKRLTPRERYARTESEDEFTKAFLDLASMTGWPKELRYHPYDSRKSRIGYPDWTMVSLRHHAIIWAELKKSDGIVTPDQLAWNAALREVTEHQDFRALARIWRPGDWDEIVSTLTGGT